ncbi:Uncharacterised protein [uncultured archaeon]|nr:Uncharacterised protein [uncultured archaeon]
MLAPKNGAIICWILMTMPIFHSSTRMCRYAARTTNIAVSVSYLSLNLSSSFGARTSFGMRE